MANPDPHGPCQDFLATSVPSLDEDQAREIFEHLPSCENCSNALAKSEEHAEVLLDALHPPTMTPPASSEVTRDQAELVVFGDAVLNRLAPMSAEMKTAMEAPLPPEAKSQLWTLSAIPTSRLRAALACSEGALALGAFLATKRRKPTTAHLNRDRLLLDSEKEVPADYFAERIAEYSHLPEEFALLFWRAFVDIMIEGQIGCLGLFASTVASDEISLALVD